LEKPGKFDICLCIEGKVVVEACKGQNQTTKKRIWGGVQSEALAVFLSLQTHNFSDEKRGKDGVNLLKNTSESGGSPGREHPREEQMS